MEVVISKISIVSQRLVRHALRSLSAIGWGRREVDGV
jgi:hypothetical protein